METILKVLSELIPLWAAIAVGGLAYLIILIRRTSERFLEIANKQIEFMKDRVDVVDKSTTIFERTIERQEKEVKGLNEQVARLTSQLQSTRETEARLSISELKVFESGIQQISDSQASLQRMLLDMKPALQPPEIEFNIKQVRNEIAHAIRSRDLSRFQVTVSPIDGADEFVREINAAGFSGQVYEAHSDLESSHSAHRAIWLGERVPYDIAISIIKLAKESFPHLDFIHLSGEGGNEPMESWYEVYIGGATSSAVGFLNLLPWSDENFERLCSAQSDSELHSLVRSNYRASRMG